MALTASCQEPNNQQGYQGGDGREPGHRQSRSGFSSPVENEPDDRRCHRGEISRRGQRTCPHAFWTSAKEESGHADHQRGKRAVDQERNNKQKFHHARRSRQAF